MNSTKIEEPGKWNRKHGVMVFKANHGYQSTMDRIVHQYVNTIKLKDPEVLVLEETDDFKVKSWIVGNPKNISKMVDEEFNTPL